MAESGAENLNPNSSKLQKKSHKRHFLFVSLAVILIAVGLFVYEVHRLTGTASGTIVHSSTVVKTSLNDFNFEPVAVKGAYVSFSYPASMSVYTAAQKQSYPIVEAHLYSYYDIKTWLLSITITKLASDSLSADSAYHADQLNPSAYSPSTVVLNNKSYKVMTDKDAIGFNEIAFALNGGMSAEISLIGNDNLGVSSLQKTFNLVLATFSWN